MKKLLVIFSLLIAGPATAQQQITPSQMALQIDNAINNLAQAAEQVPILQSQLMAAQARIKMLEDQAAKNADGPKETAPKP